MLLSNNADLKISIIKYNEEHLHRDKSVNSSRGQGTQRHGVWFTEISLFAVSSLGKRERELSEVFLIWVLIPSQLLHSQDLPKAPTS